MVLHRPNDMVLSITRKPPLANAAFRRLSDISRKNVASFCRLRSWFPAVQVATENTVRIWPMLRSTSRPFQRLMGGSMKCVLGLMAGMATSVVIAAAQPVSTSTADRSDPSLTCREIAAHIGPIQDLREAVFNYPLVQLSREPHPAVEFAREMGRPDKQTMVTLFHPTADLAEVFGQYADDSTDWIQVLGFPGSDFHAISTEGGSDHCMTFEFFAAPKNDKAHRLSRLPAWVDADGEGLCRPHAGYLVRSHGQEGFLIRDEGRADFSVALRYVPFEHGRWHEGCRIDVAVPVEYTPAKVFIAKAEPLTRPKLEEVMPKIIVAQMHADEDQKEFSFSDTAKPAIKIGGRPTIHFFQESGNFALPLFGADDTVAAKYRLPESRTKLVSVRLNGRPYLMRSGLAETTTEMKWPAILVILYRVDDENAPIILSETSGKAVASAMLEMRPGKPTITIGSIK